MKLDLPRHGVRLGRALAKWLHRGVRSRPARHTMRWTYYAGAAVLALLAVAYTAARLLFPEIETRKAEIEQYLSVRTAHVVRIEKLSAYWDGLLPGVHIEGLNVSPVADQRPAVRLAELHATFALLPLAWGQIEIRSLVLTRPSVTLERLVDGRMRVVGFEPVAIDEPGADEKFIQWLLRQQQLTIRDGEIAWVDRRAGAERVQFSEVQFDLRNRGDRHKAGLRARFPEALCRDCSVAFDITGNPLAGTDWGGQIYLRAAQLDIDALPRIARERLPAALHGRFDVEAWSDWEDGVVAAVRGNVVVAKLQLPLRGLAQPVRVNNAQGGVVWQRDSDGWRLDLTPLSLDLHGTPWSVGHLRLVRDEDEHRLRVRHIALAEISSFIADLQGEHPLLKHWTQMNPRGALDRLDLEIRGPLTAPQDYRVRAELARVTTEAHAAIPGVGNLSGMLDLRRDEGEFKIDTHDLMLTLPHVFRGPLHGGRLQGVVAWQREDSGWRVLGRDLTVVSADGSATGEMQFEMPDDRGRSPYLKVRADFKNGNVGAAAKYYPAARLPPKILAWMDSVFVGGTITHGTMLYDGPIRDFPFDNGSGRFEVRGHVRDGVYRYFKGWAPITGAEIDVAVTGRDVLVTGSGRIGALSVDQVVVQTRPTADPARRRVAITGKVQGPVAESLRVLRDVEPDAKPAPFWRPYLPPLQATGQGVMTLDIDVPLGAPGAAFTGEYQVAGATLTLAAPALAASSVSGHVRFSDRGLDAAKLNGRLLGGAFAVNAARTPKGQLALNADGQVSGSELGRLHAAALAQRISGNIDWRVEWHEGVGLGDLRVQAALDKLRFKLPPPFDRSERASAERLTVATEQSRDRSHSLSIDAGDIVRGKLVLEDRDGWRLARGHVGFGMARVALPARPGLQISARLDRVDIDQWLPLLGGGTGAPPPALVRSIGAEIKQLDMFNRSWGRIYLDLAPERGAWRATIDGDSVAGQARYVPANGRQPTAIKLDLSQLKLPPRKAGGDAAPVDPRRLPALDLRAASFEYKGRQIGEVDLSGAPYDQGWRVARLNVTRPEGRFTSRGSWRTVGGRHASAFDVEFSTSDIGATMDALGAAGQMKGGKVDVRTQLAWNGSPTDPKLASLDGRFEIAAEKGRFLRLDPGAARLFGLLDLRAITRYLTLDFSSIFGKGLAFDLIHGTITIERGNAYTDDFFLRGPSVALTAQGRLGLAAEDFDLVLAVNPKFSDTLTLTSWGLFGPQAAAAILAIQKLFKKQIAAGTRVTYLVKGSWDDPTITKVGKATAEGGSQSE